MSIIAFVQSRVARGAMLPVAVSRVNRLVRVLDRGLHFQLCAVRAEAAAPRGSRLHTQSIALGDANSFVNTRHRHLAGTVGHKFSIGCFSGIHLVGVAIIGRPVAAALDKGVALEILRVATDGSPNACSKLYAAARAAIGQAGYLWRAVPSRCAASRSRRASRHEWP